jgi:hypothetical protein
LSSALTGQTHLISKNLDNSLIIKNKILDDGYKSHGNHLCDV